MGGVKVFSGQDVNTLEAREYDIDALARYLGIRRNDLPLLAALTGNDMGEKRENIVFIHVRLPLYVMLKPVSAKDDLASFHARICALECNNNNGPKEQGSTSSGATSCTESYISETRTLPDSYNELRCELCAVQMNSPKQAQYVCTLLRRHDTNSIYGCVIVTGCIMTGNGTYRKSSCSWDT